jgi:hypothetical protein
VDDRDNLCGSRLIGTNITSSRLHGLELPGRTTPHGHKAICICKGLRFLYYIAEPAIHRSSQKRRDLGYATRILDAVKWNGL